MESHGFDCDTEFAGGRMLTGDELEAQMLLAAGPCRNVVLTGGEPLLQVDDELIQLLLTRGWYLAVETNGSLPVPKGIDWITVSPKVAEHALQQALADEVKYVRAHGQALPKPHIKAAHYLLSPAWSPSTGFDNESLSWCLQLVKEHPTWRLSMQQHKIWRVR
jgi:organic radical activating enzyme